MKTILSCLLLALPAAAQTPVDASHPGQLYPTLQGGTQAMGGAQSASDDFNRADSTNMGADWTERQGDLNIANNAGHGTSSVSWMTHNSLAAPYASSVHQIDFLPQATGAGIIFVAFTVGSAASSSDNIFVKVQDNTSDGIYDRVFFYKGVNGSSWDPNYSYPLATPTAAGRMQLSFSPDGDIAILDVDTNSDGTYDEQFQVPGILAAFSNVGTDYGISTYQDPTFDNWNVNGGSVGTAFCFADTTANICPCGNNALEESGCTNSSGLGAILDASGDASVGADTLVLSVTQAAPSTPGLYFSGPGETAPALFGDGFRCVAGPVIRLGVVFSDPAGNSATNFSISNREGLAGGELRSYQFWYRDPAGPCSNGFNTSNGYSVQW